MSIPDYQWGNADTVLSRAMKKFGSTKPGSWTVRKLMPLDRKLLLKTRGRRTLLGPIGVRTLVLETIGRKSGQRRLSPLLFARDGDSIIVVGSNFGQAHHPAWTANLIANPEATVITGGVELPVTATLLQGDDAASGWARMEDIAGAYTVYKSRTDREIRVFRLTLR